MRLCISLLVCLIALTIPNTGHAKEALPLTDLTRVDAAISTPFKGLMDDYLHVLFSQTRLTYNGNDFVSHSWSHWRDVFYQACQADPSACTHLLQAQFDILAAEWQKVDLKNGFVLHDAVLISALSDMCQVAGFLEMGDRCNQKYNLAAIASIAWQNLGYDHLFRAFENIDQQDRGQMRSWLENESKLPHDEIEQGLKLLERDPGANERDAYSSELTGNFSLAYSGWLVMLLQHFTKSNERGVLTALVNLARLAAVKEQGEVADKWWQQVQTFLVEHPELKESSQGLLTSQRFSIDVDLSRGKLSTFDASQRLQSLIDQKYPFTVQALQYALMALKEQLPARALEVLKRAQSACDGSAVCAFTRRQNITALLRIIQGEDAALKRVALDWQNRRTSETLLSMEIQVAWALADRLLETGAKAEAAALYQSLDGQIELSRNQYGINNPADVARYDDLKRMRVRVNAELGNRQDIRETESLRGQNLLQRLRTQRWLKELSAADDPETRAEFDRQLATVRENRQKLRELPPGAPPLMQAIVQALLLDYEGADQMEQYQYLNRLAAKKSNANWIIRQQALMQYQLSENFSSSHPIGDALDNDIAYLSWLRVPGGYVGTSIAVTPRNLLLDRDLTNDKTRHSIRQKYIPFTLQDESVLQLYRDLLQSGAGQSRGRLSLSLPDKTGLMLNGQSLWLDAGGSFVVGPTAPAGGRRLGGFSQLSSALFDRLLAPFAPHYQDARLLIISPDGPLSYLPFETLNRQGVSVLETSDIAYVQSLAVYAELKKRVGAKKPTSEPALLSVADPQYTAPAPGSDKAEGDSRQALEGGSWALLPGTRKESAAITSLYPNSRQLLGAEARTQSLADLQQQSKLKEFRILHFATHGYVDDTRSALVLTPGASPDSAFLMDKDIVGWDLDSDLVLLSACNTGVGRQQTGEGIVGLPYAFFMAGNVNTLMSLWPVDDAGTAALMPAFMQRVRQGEDQVRALNDTKRAFARGDFGKGLSDPRVWSAFVLYGVSLTRQQQ